MKNSQIIELWKLVYIIYFVLFCFVLSKITDLIIKAAISLIVIALRKLLFFTNSLPKLFSGSL